MYISVSFESQSEAVSSDIEAYFLECATYLNV